MFNSSSIPGAFPTDPRNSLDDPTEQSQYNSSPSRPLNNTNSQFLPSTSSRPHPDGNSRPHPDGSSNISHSSSLLEQEDMTRFSSKQRLNRKTSHQHNLITQLQVMVYLLVCYQFIKYCHSAALVPVLLHIGTQFLISCNLITNNQGSQTFGLASLVLSAASDDTLEPEVREQILKVTATKLCLSIYLKTLFILMYHMLFVCAWEVSIVDDGNLQQLTHGAWWFVSFIGEEVADLSPQALFWTKITRLGLFELLMSDMVILFLQLVLYQCVYRQSTLMGRSVGEEEVYVVRTSSDGVGQYDDSIDMVHEIPVVLKIRLYEVFSGKSFLWG